MRPSTAVVRLSLLIAMLALIAAGTGLFWQGGGGQPFAFTTLRGEVAQIHGQGLYRYDTPIVALGNKAGDAVTLVLGVPLLLFSLLRYRKGSLRGGLMLSGVLAYFLYYYGSTSLGTAYNNLFLVYVTLFSASLFALIFALASFDLAAIPAHVSERLPRRATGIYLIVSGIVLALVWLVPIVIPALIQGRAPPEVWSYTTFTTGVVDLAIVAPALVVTGALLLRRAPVGYLLSATMLVYTVVLGANLTVAGVLQLLAGVVTVAQFIGFTAGFSVLTLLAVGFTIAFFRDFADAAATGETPTDGSKGP